MHAAWIDVALWDTVQRFSLSQPTNACAARLKRAQPGDDVPAGHRGPRALQRMERMLRRRCTDEAHLHQRIAEKAAGDGVPAREIDRAGDQCFVGPAEGCLV